MRTKAKAVMVSRAKAASRSIYLLFCLFLSSFRMTSLTLRRLNRVDFLSVS